MALGLALSEELMTTKKGNGRSILLTIPTKRCLASYSSSAESVKNSRHVRVSRFGVRESFACGIWNPRTFFFYEIWNLGLWNLEYRSRNPESH